MHWSDKYVGRAYVVGEYDCGHLAQDVLTEFHSEQVTLPSRSSFNVLSLSQDIEDHKDDYIEPTDNPADGDVVLMKCRGLFHIGIFMNVQGINHVLHNMKNVGSVVVHKVRDLPKYGLSIEGMYKYKNKED